MESLGKIGKLPMGTPFTFNGKVCYVIVCHMTNERTLYRRILKESKNHKNPILHTFNTVGQKYNRTFSIESDKEVFEL